MIVGFTIAQVEGGAVLAVLLGLFPVASFVACTRGGGMVRVAVLSLVLAAYTFGWVVGTFDYDTSSTGSLVFFFLPVYGVVAVLIGLVVARVGAAIFGHSPPAHR